MIQEQSMKPFYITVGLTLTSASPFHNSSDSVSYELPGTRTGSTEASNKQEEKVYLGKSLQYRQLVRENRCGATDESAV